MQETKLIEFKRVCKHNGVVTIDIPTKKHHFFKGCKKIKQNIYKLLSVVVKTNLEIIFDTDLDICNIIKLFFSDYVIFLTSYLKYYI